MKPSVFLLIALTAVVGVACHSRGSRHPAVCLPGQWRGALGVEISTFSQGRLIWNFAEFDSVAVDYKANRFALNRTTHSGKFGLIGDLEKQSMWMEHSVGQ